MKTKKQIGEAIDDKLYLFNLLNNTKYTTYFEAQNSNHFRTDAILSKLTYLDIEYLINKIESLL